MKVLLYFENQALIARSGIGRALALQKEALAATDVEVTTDPTATDYDILHINTYGLKSGAMIRRARRLGKKVVYHAHSTYEDFRNSFTGSNLIAPLYRWHLTRLYRQADHLITPTPYAKDLVTAYGGMPPITPVSNGVVVSKYAADRAKVAAFRKYFAITPDQKVVISVGLFFERKGIDDFVALARRHPEYEFIWFGQINLRLIPRRVRQLVTRHGLPNLRFPGYISGDVLLGAFQGADLFLYPSREETEGIVVLEALASHQRTLVRDIPVYDPWLVAGQSTYKATDLADFDRQMQALLAGDLADTTAAGAAVVAERDLTMIGHQLQAVYQQVLGESSC